MTGYKSKGRTYYYYRMPDGSREALGKDYQTAVETTSVLNVALRESGDLVDRILSRKDRTKKEYNPRNPPMNQVIEEYREDVLRDKHKRKKLSDATLKAKLTVLAEYDHLLGNIDCQQVTTFDLAQHLKDRSGHVQVKHIPLLKSLFSYAISEGYRDINPANELQPKEPEARKRKRHTWEGFQQVRRCAPEWLQRTMDIALYSLQRRADLTQMHKNHVDRNEHTVEILQQKTRNYSQPVYIKIKAGDALWQAVDSALSSDVPCPYLIHCRPLRNNGAKNTKKKHPFAVLPDFLSKQFAKHRDESGAYKHLPKNERPTLHDIRALGILMYHKAGYPIDYIMALAGHCKASTTEIYLAGHEERKPLIVNADLSMDQVQVNEIDWQRTTLPPELARLIEDPNE